MRTLHAFLVLVCLGLGSAEGAVTLSWDPNIEPDLGGYLLSYGTASGQYIGTIDVGNVTSFQFVEPDPTIRYYLALRAYDTGGANSPFSNEVVTTPAAAGLTLNGLSSNRTSPQVAGISIAFSTGGTGGTPPYRYKWFIVNGSTTTVAQNWSTSNTFTWVPTVAGTGYRIRVWARNASSTADAPANPGAVLEMAYTITATANLAPSVSAGANKTITLPSGTTLTGTASDDGKPVPPGRLTLSWTKVSGPGTVTFGTPAAATTTASFSAAGSYVLRLTGSDGALSRSDDVTVTANAASGGGSGTGLRGQYFRDSGSTHLQTAVMSRTDPSVNFNWGTSQPPSPLLSADRYSIRWKGQVEAPVTGNYTFSTVSDDGVRLWVGGQLLINNWTNHTSTTNTSRTMALTAGVKYYITLEYYEATGPATIQLRWTPPGQATAVIPQTRLFP